MGDTQKQPAHWHNVTSYGPDSLGECSDISQECLSGITIEVGFFAACGKDARAKSENIID